MSNTVLGEVKHTRSSTFTIGQGSKNGPSPRIVGGIRAEEGEFPYFVDWAASCGASLIHSDILLTAAHCDPIRSNNVIVGAYSKGSTSHGAEERVVTARVVHPGWDRTTFENDFLIMKLNQPIENGAILPVELNEDTMVPYEGQELFVMGLGAVREGEVTSAFLKKVPVEYVPHRTCNSQSFYNGNIQEVAMLCAGVSEGGRDAVS